MTRRLRKTIATCPVQLLWQSQRVAGAGRAGVGGGAGSRGICREVILHGDGGPGHPGWTLFAEAALQGGGLQDLGEQPLGSAFGDPLVRRDHLQLAC